jgi:hypothetical protein
MVVPTTDVAAKAAQRQTTNVFFLSIMYASLHFLFLFNTIARDLTVFILTKQFFRLREPFRFVFMIPRLVIKAFEHYTTIIVLSQVFYQTFLIKFFHSCDSKNE